MLPGGPGPEEQGKFDAVGGPERGAGRPPVQPVGVDPGPGPYEPLPSAPSGSAYIRRVSSAGSPCSPGKADMSSAFQPYMMSRSRTWASGDVPSAPSGPAPSTGPNGGSRVLLRD
ncbi:hypothetical protein NKH18_39040 [Streptomyces sp. M10(2022)]